MIAPTADRQQFLESLARGKCSAVSRTTPLGFRLGWYPTVSGEEIPGPSVPRDGFTRKSEAVAAAKKFRDDCRNQIALANGEE